MDFETYNKREKMLKLREKLLAVEEDKMAGKTGCTLDELNSYLDDITLLAAFSSLFGKILFPIIAS